MNFAIFLTILIARGGYCVPLNEIENDFSQSEGKQTDLNYGLRLYAADEDTPTCVGHGFIYDEKKRDEIPMESFKIFHNWAEATVEQHNEERIKLGYNPITLSQHLSDISYGFAQLIANSDELKLRPDYSNDDQSDYDFDILYEETYYNEILHFQAPDVNEQSFRACCPAPFTRLISNETKEVGLSRIVRDIVGNFKKMVVIGVFSPKSDEWYQSGQCDTDETFDFSMRRLRSAMHDSSEYYNGDYEDDVSFETSPEDSSDLKMEADAEVIIPSSKELHI